MDASTSFLGRIMSKTGLLRTSEKKDKDRRRSKRHRIDLPVRYRMYLPSRPENASPELKAQLYDISEHGLGLLTDAIQWEGLNMVDPDMQTSQKCIVEVEVPYDEEPLRLRGRAVWYIRHPEGIPFVFRVGVEFVGLTPELKNSVQNLINLYVAAAEIL
jgi:c-di-GMP-binding flagellar brake protein YcgR